MLILERKQLLSKGFREVSVDDTVRNYMNLTVDSVQVRMKMIAQLRIKTAHQFAIRELSQAKLYRGINYLVGV
jgi:hypothetical protein